MKEQIIYRKVFIRGEEDLPSKEAKYFVGHKMGGQLTVWFIPEHEIGNKYWLDNYDWYLLPVPLPSDEEIKDAQDDYGQKHQEDEFGYTICSITSTAFGGGIKWLKSRLTDK